MPLRPLEPHPTTKPPRGPVVCVVMDGVGLGAGDEGDAVASAHTPTLDRLARLPSYTSLAAHGTAVGMPSDDDMGNSEVGHNALGAGRVFDQGAKLVANAIADGSIYDGAVWNEVVERAAGGTTLHFIGLLSDGNVHSHIDHLLAMLRRAAQAGVKSLRVHALLDGRDVPSRSALTYVDQLEAVLEELRQSGVDARVASGGGRMTTTMDRYQADWSMVHRGWDLHVRGRGRPFTSLREAVQTLYDESERGDQDLEGFVIVRDQRPVGPIEDGDTVVLFNFRGDRAIELSKAFDRDDFTAFDRSPRPDVLYAGMMQYDGDEGVPHRFLVAPPSIDRTMGQLLTISSKRQLAISETQKFGHVTYFWNGNRSEKFDRDLEDYVQIPSGSEPFEQRPWMKAAEITDAVIAAMREQRYDFVRLNYANGDMVGHTGVLDAARLAVEVVDLCVGRLLRVITELGGRLVVTADHGNADQMFDVAKDGERKIRTSHSLNPVPFSVFDPSWPDQGPALGSVDRPGLGNVAATCLELMGLRPPEDYLPSLLAP